MWRESKQAEDWASFPHRNFFKNLRVFWGQFQAPRVLLFKSILKGVPKSRPSKMLCHLAHPGDVTEVLSLLLSSVVFNFKMWGKNPAGMSLAG